jgi:receptor-type tyrosine-protein phosphatase gamma
LLYQNLRFYALYRVGEDGEWDVNNGISTSSNETSYQVTGLYPFTVYSFRVLAVNAMGRSRVSKESYYMVTLREGECGRSYVRPFLECEYKYGAVSFTAENRDFV